jgi:hypothetical protein
MTSVVAKYDRRAGNIQPAPITAAPLVEISFAEPWWLIWDMSPVAAHVLAGKPKKAKSSLVLGACESVATGGRDYRRRLQKRPKKVLGGRPAPESMFLETSWPRLREGGATLLDYWLTSHPDARLVVIDKLTKIREPASGRNVVYAEDRAHIAEKRGERKE